MSEILSILILIRPWLVLMLLVLLVMFELLLDMLVWFVEMLDVLLLMELSCVEFVV